LSVVDASGVRRLGLRKDGTAAGIVPARRWVTGYNRAVPATIVAAGKLDRAARSPLGERAGVGLDRRVSGPASLVRRRPGAQEAPAHGVRRRALARPSRR